MYYLYKELSLLIDNSDFLVGVVWCEGGELLSKFCKQLRTTFQKYEHLIRGSVYHWGVFNLQKMSSKSTFMCWYGEWICSVGKNFRSGRGVTKRLFGCVYIPPEGSKYANEEAFDDIEHEMTTLIRNSPNMHCALVGDFNAKTGTLSDYIIPDHTLLHIFDLDQDDDILNYMEDYKN